MKSDRQVPIHYGIGGKHKETAFFSLALLAAGCLVKEQAEVLHLPKQHLVNRITRSLRTVLLFHFFSNLCCLFEVSRIVK